MPLFEEQNLAASDLAANLRTGEVETTGSGSAFRIRPTPPE